MSKNGNPMSRFEPWDLVASGYAETTMQMFEQFAEAAVAVSKLKPGAAVLDVACGPGTLSLIVAREAGKVHGIDFSQAMLHCFAERIDKGGFDNIDIQHGDAQVLPYANDTYDAAFSMFGLMFFPDRNKGFSEIYRTLKPGGAVVVTSWAPVAQSPVFQLMFGALKAIRPEMPEPQTAIDTLENPELFKQEMAQAGFKDVEIRRVTGSYPVESVRGFWDGMVKGSAPIQMMKNGMCETLWQEKEKSAIAFLEQQLPQMPTALTSDAWMGVGIK